MSEENTNILDLGDEAISFMSPEEAKTKIDQVMRDPKGPYFDNSNLKLHRQAGEKMQKLYQVASPDELQTNAEGEVLVQQWPPHMVKVMEEALQDQEAKKQKLRAEAQAEMDILVDEHDYERAEIPEDIQPWQVNLLKAQRLNKEKATPDNLRELNLILEKEAHGVKFDPELSSAISHLSQARLTLGVRNPEEFAEIAENVIHLINKAHDKQKTKGKK